MRLGNQAPRPVERFAGPAGRRQAPFQLGPQQALGAVQAGFDAGFADPQKRSGLRRIHAFDFPELENRTVPARQRVQREPQQAAQLPVENLLFRITSSRGQQRPGIGAERRGIEIQKSRLTMQLGHGAVYRDSDEPGGKTRAAGELIEVTERIEVSLLHEILDVRIVLKDAAGHTPQLRAVAAHQDFIELGLPGAHAR